MCLFAAIEYRFVRVHVNNFLAAKAVAVYIIPIITGFVFYGYTAIIGDDVLYSINPSITLKNHEGKSPM